MLEAASLTYLALPWVIFAVGWLQPLHEIGAIAVLVLAAIGEMCRHRNRAHREVETRAPGTAIDAFIPMEASRQTSR